MSNNAKNIMKLSENQLNMFWGFLRNSWKSGSLLKNPVLCYRCQTMLKIPWNTQKTPPKHVLILNNLLAMVRCLGQPTLFIILQMIYTDRGWGAVSYSSLSITQVKIYSSSYLIKRLFPCLNFYLNLTRKQKFTIIMDFCQVKLSQNQDI